MPSPLHGANPTTSHHHVNQNRQSTSSHASRLPSSSPTKPLMTSNGNGNGNGAHFHAASPSAALSPTHVALDKSKQIATSPHKLMMGVPPAATPSLASASNDSSSRQQQPPHDAHHANGHANGSAVVAVDTKGKQKQVDPIDAIPLAQLEQELPLEEADLVSLAALVERLANYGYESLQNLAETLPSLPSSSKRAKIFNTALDVRKQFIKLLVLARWSKDVADLQKSRNIIALLSEQQWQHEDVFAGLTDIRKILPNARMRNADLPTAIDVLQTGTYRRLPSSIKDMAVATKPFTDEQALAIVTRLEEALRTRMACRERVPAPLSSYSIRDGKVHFSVPGLFDAQLTASSGGQDADDDTPTSADDRWWLLDLSFDVAATGSCAESSTRSFPRKPKKAYRERLRVWGDQELAPKSQSAQSEATADEDKSDPLRAAAQTAQDTADEKPADAKESKEIGQPAETTLQDEPATVKASAERDAPLSRLFAFLQERSLHYQMDILQHQAYELCRLNWGANLRVETSERPRRLTLHYWTQAQGADGAAQRADSPAAGGSVRITIVDLPDRAGATKTLAMLLDDDSDPTSKTEERTSPVAVKRRGLQVTWDAHASILADAETSNLVVSPHSLDVESLLSSVIKRHTLALLRNLQRRILVSDHAVSRLLRPEDCTLCVEHAQRQGDEFSTATEATSFSFLQIELRRSSRPRSAINKQGSTSGVPPLRLSVDAVSGRLLLDAETTQSSTTDLHVAQQAANFTASILTTRPTNARLTEASDRINESMEAIFDVLYRLEVFARVEEWERMASYLGLRAVRNLNLRAQDLVKFGPSTSTSPDAAPQLFIPLRNSFPGYFLALQPSELAGATIALVYVVQMMEATGAPTLTVQSIEWLDRAKIAAASNAGSDGEDDAAVLAAAEAGQKRKDAPGGVPGQASEADGSFGKKDLTMEELGDVHSYCIALVSYFRVEQQLRMRGIPYLHVGSNTSRSSPPAKRQRRLPSTRFGPQSADARDEGLFDEEENGADEPADEAHQSASDTGVAALVPSLCLRAADLLGPARSHLTKPNVSLRIRDWDDSDKCCVQMRIKLRMKSRRFRTLHEVVSFAPTSDQHTTSPLTWIDFDNETSLLTLSTRDLDNCIPTFYTQWERVMRMVQLAREVLNVSRAWQQRALRSRVSCKKPAGLVELRRFDFDTVVFSYGSMAVDGTERKLLVRVRWQDAKMEMQPYTNMPVTQSGGYVVEFGSIPTGELESLDSPTALDASASAETAARKHDEAVSKWFGDVHAAANPHNALAFELRRTVNVAARTAAMHAAVHPHAERTVWRGFFKLLQDTLALVREMAPLADKCLSEPDVPEVEVKSATWFRLRFRDRYALDLRLVTRSRLLVSDAARALFRSEGQQGPGQEEEVAGSETADADLFAGSDLLNSLIAGTAPRAHANSAAKAKGAATSHVDPTPAAAALQFQPIPNIDSVLRKVHAALHPPSAAADDDGVHNLRRALLVSLAPATSTALKSEPLLGTLIPLLVELVSREIGG
ncbi:related to RNA polymerase II mediator complex protein pmc1 [Sporisorium reilianum SRZ2]|uniref:Mediator of RNA polymerase II transcription subunit 14 n=1 Tax=Sporisorium reilianum (strain SRZ2) TaxID=999809 RepID=E6ZZ49_SPORE|nr:related to RNA polymerase II mediator complex protein pmc1 [Sporisorium reilianum SRZ2]